MTPLNLAALQQPALQRRFPLPVGMLAELRKNHSPEALLGEPGR